MQAGERLLDHVLGRGRLVDQQQGQPDQPHAVRAVQVLESQWRLRSLRGHALGVDRVQPGQRAFHAALGAALDPVYTIPCHVRTLPGSRRLAMAWFTVETRYVADRDRLLDVRPRHRDYLRDLVDQGKVLAGGP